MKKLFILVLWSLMAFTALSDAVQLPIAVAPLNGDILENAEWDFSHCRLVDDGARTSVRVYGDSLMSEIFDGRRFWYALGDSVYFMGEEDRLTSIILEKPAFITSTPLLFGFNNPGVGFEAKGLGGGRQFGVCERGSVEFISSTRPGVLILAPGDTINEVLMSRERRFVTANFPSDSASMYFHMIIEIHRWFDIYGTASLLPIAVQRSVYAGSTISANQKPVFSLAYLPDTGNDTKERKRINDNNRTIDSSIEKFEDALNEAEIILDGRSITVYVSIPEPEININFDIVDASGYLYLHKSAISSGTAEKITLDCSGLRSGEYIAVVGIEEIPVAPNKKLIIIR